MSAKTPDRRLDLVLLLQLFRPENGPFLRIQAEEIALGAERVDLAVRDRRRAARTGGIGNVIGTVVLVLPEDLPINSVQAQDAFLASEAIPAAGVVGTLAVRAKVI